ncbi:MAG: hypothetical protein Q7T61_09665 [Caulobacter sp.]|nr:hypothetical protein [Caulobacter sp.]
MRLIIAMAVTAVVLPTAALAETWLPVAKGGAHVSYADPDALTGDDGEVVVREMKVYDPPITVDGQTIQARIVNYRFACDTTRFRILDVENVDENGKSLGVSPIAEDWREPVAAGTIGDKLAAFGCGRMSMDPNGAVTRSSAIRDGRWMLSQ